jgi:hypothetical protein
MNNPFLTIMTNHINENGKVVDAIICRQIAEYINSRPFSESPMLMGDNLWHFIDQYGEDEDCNYIGRDEHGEKQYVTYNPDTNWHERIRKELVALGFYLRYANLHEEKELALLQAS